MSDTAPEVLTPAEVASLLRVSPETVYRMKVQLIGFHVSARGEGRGRLRFTREGIAAYMEARRCRSLSPPELRRGSPALSDGREMRALAVRRIHERKAGQS